MAETPTKDERRERLFLLFLLLIPCLFINLELDSDTYWLINSGRYVFAHGIPYVEPFTLHEGLRFVMQQWLSAAIFAAVYDALGSAFLFALVAIVYAAILFSVFRLCMHISEGNFLISFTVAYAAAIPLNLFMVLRPYLFTILLLTVELNILEEAAQTQRRGKLWLLPLLSALLVNLHAAMWLFFFVLMLPYAVDSFRFKVLFVRGEGMERRTRRTFAAAAAASFAAGFANPYGWESMTYLFRSYGNAYVSASVNEMQSPDFKTVSGIFVFLVYLAVVLLYASRRSEGTKLRYALLTIGTGFLGLSSIRSLVLFFACGIPFVAYSFRSAKIVQSAQRPRSFALRYALVCAIVVILGAFFVLRASKSEEEAQSYLPVEAVAYIKENCGDSIRLYTDYNTGGYAEFMGLRPFIDARAEVFYQSNNGKEDIIDDYFDVKCGRMDYHSLIDKYRLTHLLVAKDDILATYLPKDPAFDLLYHDGEFAVYAVKSPPQ